MENSSNSIKSDIGKVGEIMKKKLNFIGVVLIILLFLFSIVIPTYSYGGDTLGLGDLDKYEGTNPGSEKLVNKANVLFSSIRNIGIILSVIILIVIGIKYMLGSVEEKAEYKKTLLPYIVGAFLLFTGSLIPQLIYDIIKKNL